VVVAVRAVKDVPTPTNTDGSSVPTVAPTSSEGSSGSTPTPTPTTPSAPTPAKGKKHGKMHRIRNIKKHLPVEAAYYGEHFPRRPKQYTTPEYGDPNPRKTEERLRREMRTGKPVHKRVFTANYFSPLPGPHPHVKCFKGRRDEHGRHHEKCYRVDRKTGKVIGRNPVQRMLPRVVVHTGTMHRMEKKGFQNAQYDEKLALWKPRKSKRTLAPAPVMSFAEVDAEAEDEDEEEAADEEEAEDEEETEEEDEEESEDETEAEGEDEAEDEAEDEDEAEEEAEEEVEEEAEAEEDF